MADVQDLHQIEYRHHQTKDLSPVASSMTSRESLAGWDSRIRAWVRHPNADVLSESACYQVFPNGQAALAWRYWDERAAVRADGTIGRPLVSRVLAGPASVLTPEVALASCRAGLSEELAGPLPGQVPDGSELPMVSGGALIARAREMTAVLDQASITQPGLQAVVAAALAEPSVPLAISMRDNLIRLPLGECVQCPLLWGLRRIAGPLLGPAGRSWSFSTFELPLGNMDPASLPGIVFREVQDGVKAPPSRFRREARVRPLEDGALAAQAPYAAMIELAGWLTAEYRERGGDGLQRFIAELGGSATSLPMRMHQVTAALRKAHQPSGADATRPAGVPDVRDVAPVAPVAPATYPSPAEEGTSPPAAAPAFPATAPVEAGSGEPRPPHAAGARTGAARPGVAGISGAGDNGSGPAGRPAPWPAPADFAGGPAPADPYRAAGRHRGEAVARNAGDGPLAPSATRTGSDSPVAPPPRGSAGPHPGWYQSPRHPLGPSQRAGQTAPPLFSQDHGGQPGNAMATPGGARNPSPRSRESVISLLQKLELMGQDQRAFEAILDDACHQARDMTPGERSKSWDIISNKDWHENVRRNNAFRPGDLASIFGISLIPEPPADVLEKVADWALKAPPPLVDGLLAAARSASDETWGIVTGILEPVLAYRWTIEHDIPGHWDVSRMAHSYANARRAGADSGLRSWLSRFLRIA